MCYNITKKRSYFDEEMAMHAMIGIELDYICSARMRNLDGYVTGHPLRNRSSGYITGRPDALPMYNASRLRNRLARCITSVFGYVQ